jgi:hypothetical protein
VLERTRVYPHAPEAASVETVFGFQFSVKAVARKRAARKRPVKTENRKLKTENYSNCLNVIKTDEVKR